MTAPDRTEVIIGAPAFGSSVARRDRCHHGAAGMADDERARVAARASSGDERVIAARPAAKAVSVEQVVAEALTSADEDERHVVLWVRSEGEGHGRPGGRGNG